MVEDVNPVDWFHKYHYLEGLTDVRTQVDFPFLHPFYGYNSLAQEYPHACDYQ